MEDDNKCELYDNELITDLFSKIINNCENENIHIIKKVEGSGRRLFTINHIMPNGLVFNDIDGLTISF